MATNDTAQDTTKAEADKLKKLAEAYEKNGTVEPGFAYRYVTSGGETHAVVTPIRKKG